MNGQQLVTGLQSFFDLILSEQIQDCTMKDLPSFVDEIADDRIVTGAICRASDSKERECNKLVLSQLLLKRPIGKAIAYCWWEFAVKWIVIRD